MAGVSVRPSLLDAAESEVLGSGLYWIADTLTGTVATIIAIIAFALLGFSLLSGKIAVRRGMQIVAGAFVVFAAPLIAISIFGISTPPTPETQIQTMPSESYEPLPRRNVESDPYPGASS